MTFKELSNRVDNLAKVIRQKDETAAIYFRVGSMELSKLSSAYIVNGNRNLILFESGYDFNGRYAYMLNGYDGEDNSFTKLSNQLIGTRDTFEAMISSENGIKPIRSICCTKIDYYDEREPNPAQYIIHIY